MLTEIYGLPEVYRSRIMMHECAITVSRLSFRLVAPLPQATLMTHEQDLLIVYTTCSGSVTGLALVVLGQ